MLLRLLVLLAVLALLARRFLPRRRMSWAVPVVVGVTIVVVRSVAYVLTGD
ncbi:MAG: hypothetical protein JWN17_1742 [Frankiales bacterium]|nr:hypothetical protein [Frankiales bacterium]